MTEQSTPAEELRDAAKLLRETAANTTPGPWEFVPELYWDRSALISRAPGVVGWDVLVMDVHSELEHPAARWAALVHPGLAEPLAAWLEESAGHWDCVRVAGAVPPGPAALAVARAINGGEPGA